MNKRRLLVVVGVLFFLGALYGAAFASVGNKIPRWAKVQDVSIGGLNYEQAVQKLRELPLPKSVKVVAKGKSTTLTLANAQIGYDLNASIAQFPHRSANPITLFGYLISGRSKDAIVRVDQDLLSASLDRLRIAVADAPREGNILFRAGQPYGVRPIDGTDLDLAELIEDLKANLASGKDKFYVKVVPTKASISWAEVQRMLSDFARPAVSAPIMIYIDGNPVEVSPSLISNSLQFRPALSTKGMWLQPYIVTDQLKSDLGSSWSKYTVAPRSASFSTTNGKLTVIPSTTGKDVPEKKLSDAIVEVLSKTSERDVYLKTEEIQPKLTTEMALGLNVNDRIGTFTTRFPWTVYRAHNIHRAADILNGTVVKAGDIFSLNETLGQRTAANGFVEGVVISGGRLAKDWGGGVSQVSTTTFNAAWFAGLKILKHKPHSFYISRYPVGRESTLSWPSVDMSFQNDTDDPIVVTTSYYSNYITVSIYGTRKYDVETITGPRTNPRGFKELESDSKTCINQGGIGGFDIEVTRVLSQSGIEARREIYKTRYLSEDRLVCTNPEATFGNYNVPKPKPKPKPTATPTPTLTP